MKLDIKGTKRSHHQWNTVNVLHKAGETGIHTFFLNLPNWTSDCQTSLSLTVYECVCVLHCVAVCQGVRGGRKDRWQCGLCIQCQQDVYRQHGGGETTTKALWKFQTRGVCCFCWGEILTLHVIVLWWTETAGSGSKLPPVVAIVGRLSQENISKQKKTGCCLRNNKLGTLAQHRWIGFFPPSLKSSQHPVRKSNLFLFFNLTKHDKAPTLGLPEE